LEPYPVIHKACLSVLSLREQRWVAVERILSWLILALLCMGILSSSRLWTEQVPVRQKEGLVHGFLVLRTLDGKALADGDLIQVAHGDRVTSRLTFRFKDGSLHDETAIFSQRSRFRLLSDHLVQKGPAFEHPLDISLDASTGHVTVRYTKDGNEKTITESLSLPADVANGLLLTLLKNVGPDAKDIEISFVAATPKPRVVKLKVNAESETAFSTGVTQRKATHFVVKVEIGGISGLIAPLLGKQPPDTHVWILEGTAPAFVKSEGPLAPGGPAWRIELVSPVWPDVPASDSSKGAK